MKICKKCRTKIEESLITAIFICPGCNSLLDPEIDLETTTEELRRDKPSLSVRVANLSIERELEKEKAWKKRKDKITHLKHQRRLERQKRRKR